MSDLRIVWSNDRNWESELSKRKINGDLVVCKNHHNLRLILKHHPLFEGAICGDGRMADRAWGPIAEAVNRMGYGAYSKQMILDTIVQVAEESPRDPMREYVDSLKWDGVSRIETWLTDICGAESSETISNVGRMWLISAIARILNPGCQADHVLILCGEQGAGKSRLIQTLAGDQWYDQLRDMKSKDALMSLSGKWIIEIGELSAMYRSEVEATKNFITSRVDEYRAPYDRMVRAVPRRCVFAGTTNDGEFLSDSTGNRRFWPVRVGNIDYHKISDLRDQLFAEAKALYECGEHWWPSKDMLESLAEQAEDAYIQDPWVELVEDWAASRTSAKMIDMLKELELPADRQNVTTMKRAAAVLRKLGFEKHRNRHGSIWKRDITGKDEENEQGNQVSLPVSD